jgi:2-polyprenyl-3-methyl-5-hydroxy-6-metoxy-1,4-benzoquinol methylase
LEEVEIVNYRASSPAPARAASLALRWDEWHRAREQFELDSAVELPPAWWRAAAQRLLPPPAGLRILDVGCARGGFARDLARRGAIVTAVDISPAAIAFTREKLEPYGGTAEVADVTALPFRDGEFDAVTALETLHHVADPEAVLDELVRVTRPGGLIVISVENHASVHGLTALPRQLAGRCVSESPVWVRMSLPWLWRALRRRSCRVAAVEGSRHLFAMPGLGTREVPGVSCLRSARYFAPNVCVAVVKPR